MIRKIVFSWWFAFTILCLVPTAVFCYSVLPKIPACIGAARSFARGVAECRDEFSARQSDMRTHMLTGRVLLRSFAICARLDGLQARANEACGWLVAPDPLAKK